MDNQIRIEIIEAPTHATPRQTSDPSEEKSTVEEPTDLVLYGLPETTAGASHGYIEPLLTFFVPY